MTDGLKDAHREAIIAVIAANERVERAVLFGSRANGTNTGTPDVESVLVGEQLTLTDQARLSTAIDEIPMAQAVDLMLYDAVRDQALRDHIRHDGVEWLAPRREVERDQSVAVAGDGRGGRSRWRLASLGELVGVHKEQVKPSSSPDRMFSHHSIPAFDEGRSPAVESGSAIKSSKFTVPHDAVLVSRLNPRFPRVWTPNVVRDLAAICSTEFLVLRPRSVDRRFLHHLCMGPSFRTSLLERVTGTSGSHQRVSPAAALEIKVPVPPLSEQRAIAHVLGTLDDKMELNRRMNETLEAMVRALFKSCFVDFDPVRAKMEGRDTGLPRDVADLFPDRLVDSEMGEIPEGWQVVPLDGIARFQNGLALQRYRPGQNEDRLPVVKIAQMRAGEANSGEWASAAIKPECIIEDGDVLFSWSGSLLVMMWCGGRAALNQHLFRVTSDRYPKWFYLHSLLSHLPAFRQIAQDKATTMGHIRRHHLTEALCVSPPDGVIAELSDTFSCLLDRQVATELSSRTLAALRDTLLPKLISGEIRVPAHRPGIRPVTDAPEPRPCGEVVSSITPRTARSR